LSQADDIAQALEAKNLTVDDLCLLNAMPLTEQVRTRKVSCSASTDG
jgi:hypothetical protein